jgi:protein-tyrosine kinase
LTLEAARGQELLRLLGPAGRMQEYFRELARNLEALEEEVGSVVVTSPEPGDGRTSVCIGLGAALVAEGHRVVLLDCNLDRPQLHRVFGEPNFVGLTSALESGRPVEQCGFSPFEGMVVVPTGPVMPESGALIESPAFPEAVKRLRESRDVVLLDAPVAARVLDSPVFCTGFDGILVVVHAARTSKSMARQVTDDLLDAGANIFGAVLNGGSREVR